MPGPSSQKITITLPTALVKKLDKLAAHEYANRSGIIRRAVVKLIQEPQNQLIVDPTAVQTDKMYEYIKANHPYLDPEDDVLIRILYEQGAGIKDKN